MSMLQDLAEHLRPRLQRLDALYEEMGMSSKKKDDPKHSVHSAIIQLVDQHIDQVSKEVESLKKNISQIRHDIDNYKKALGESGTTSLNQHSKHLKMQLASLREEHANIKKDYDQRQEKVKKLEQQLQYYAEALNGIIKADTIVRKEAPLSDKTLSILSERVRACEDEFHSRKQHIDTTASKLVSLFQTLGVSSQNDKDTSLRKLVQEKDKEKKLRLYIPWIPTEMQCYIEQRATQLEEIRQQREYRKAEILQDLYQLWNGLRISDEERERFQQENAGFTTKDIENFEQEHVRLVHMKKDRIKDFITASREELERLWAKLYLSNNEKQAFRDAFSDDMTEATLADHEKEISRLQLLIKDRKQVLDAVHAHQALINEIQEFEASTNDPSRLLTKGRGDPGRLLREERFRKQITKRLPMVEQNTCKVLQEYYAKNGHHFLVSGEPYIHKINGSQMKKPTVRTDRVDRHSTINDPTRAPTPIPTNSSVSKSLSHRAPPTRLPTSKILHSVKDKVIQKPKSSNNITKKITKPLPRTHSPMTKTGQARPNTLITKKNRSQGPM